MHRSTKYSVRHKEHALANALLHLGSPEVVLKLEWFISLHVAGRLLTWFGKYPCFQLLLFVGEVW